MVAERAHREPVFVVVMSILREPSLPEGYLVRLTWRLGAADLHPQSAVVAGREEWLRALVALVDEAIAAVRSA